MASVDPHVQRPDLAADGYSESYGLELYLDRLERRFPCVEGDPVSPD